MRHKQTSSGRVIPSGLPYEMHAVDGTEVAKHNTKESCWLAIHGVAWDVTGKVITALDIVRRSYSHRSQTSLTNTQAVPT